MRAKKRSKGTLSLAEEKKLKTRYKRFSYAAWITGFSSLGLLLFQKYGDTLAFMHSGMLSTMVVLYFIGFYISLFLFFLAVSYSFLQEKRNWVIANALLIVVVFVSLFWFSTEIPIVNKHGTLTEITPQFPRYTALGAAFGGIFIGIIALFKRREN